MSTPEPQRERVGAPSCNACRHYFITHEPAWPYGCRHFAIKTRALPSIQVARASGRSCQAFSASASGPDRRSHARGSGA